MIHLRRFALVAADVRQVLDHRIALETANVAFGNPGHRQDVGARKHALRDDPGGTARACTATLAPLSSMHALRKLVEQRLQARRQALRRALRRRNEIGMVGAVAVNLDLETMQAGVIHVIGQAACGGADRRGGGR